MLPEVLSTRYTSGAETMFHGIYKLLPGHRLTFQDGQVGIKEYWDVPAGRGDWRHAVSSSADLQRESSGKDVQSRGSGSAGLPAFGSLWRGAPERVARRRQGWMWTLCQHSNHLPGLRVPC